MAQGQASEAANGRNASGMRKAKHQVGGAPGDTAGGTPAHALTVEQYVHLHFQEFGLNMPEIEEYVVQVSIPVHAAVK